MYNLQKDIIDLQYQIAWHVSHVISDRSEALRDVKKVFEHVVHTQSAIQHSLHTGTKGQLVDLYAQELYLKHIVNIYLQHQAKLLLLIDFFKKSSHADVLKQTSNIMDVIAHVEFEIITCDFMAYLKDSL